ncbi:hypothetical protein [Nocardia rhizosphaerae]|uniref:DUF3168 domain-containing protein n=1 Tax=Nocardia rhizosphaerae TaxID=1691571 RepID=A0ABV8L2F2_9NOCA
MTAIFAQIEVAVADHLTAALPMRGIIVPVRNAVPRTGRPPSYVLVTRPGGGQRNLATDGPRLVVEVVAESGADAGSLAAIVRALLRAAAPGYVGEVWIDRTRDVGLAFSPDPDTNAPRYLLTVEVWQRGAALA